MLSYDETRKKYRRRIRVDRVGIRKDIDKLGRICIPKEMRTLFRMEKEVELQVTEEGILLKNPGYVLVKKEEHEG